MDSPLMQKVGFLFCVERGVNIGGSSSARAQSMPFSAAFMEQTLKQ